MKRTDLYITQKQYTLLKKESEQKGISISEIMRRIIDLYLDTKK